MRVFSRFKKAWLIFGILFGCSVFNVNVDADSTSANISFALTIDTEIDNYGCNNNLYGPGNQSGIFADPVWVNQLLQSSNQPDLFLSPMGISCWGNANDGDNITAEMLINNSLPTSEKPMIIMVTAY